LGIPKDATKQDVKAAYLAKAREFHPDKRPDCDATLKYFTHVTKAYETLSDDHKRAIYDDDSIPDEEYFTVTIAGVKVNLFVLIVLIGTSAVGYGGYRFWTKRRSMMGCPIEIKDRTEMIEAGRKKLK
jgi:curved DNA-binding protein CbpA